MDVKTTLTDRERTYGKFGIGIRVEADIMQSLTDSYSAHHKHDMPLLYQMMLSKIVMKLTRLAVTPQHTDSWHDIGGYAKLAEDFINNNEGM